MEQTTNETALAPLHSDEEPELIVSLTARTQSFSSLAPKTQAEKVQLFNLMNNPEKRVKDEVNKEIALKHVYIELVDLINQKTGELTKAPRVILIDDKGVGYQCVSSGVYNAIRKMFLSFGIPQTWEKPITVIPVLINKGTDRSILTLNVKG